MKLFVFVINICQSIVISLDLLSLTSAPWDRSLHHIRASLTLPLVSDSSRELALSISSFEFAIEKFLQLSFPQTLTQTQTQTQTQTNALTQTQTQQLKECGSLQEAFDNVPLLHFTAHYPEDDVDAIAYQRQSQRRPSLNSLSSKLFSQLCSEQITHISPYQSNAIALRKTVHARAKVRVGNEYMCMCFHLHLYLCSYLCLCLYLYLHLYLCLYLCL